MIEVANPIYDVVFKYLLDDNKIAKLLISGLLKKEVLTLELKPQEYSSNLKRKVLTVYRIDFKAKIKLATGEEKVVLIEIQKAKFTSDILRFRKYLGEQYVDKGNIIETEKGSKEALPIITIYFLGYPLENAKGIPIINVTRQYFDHSNNNVLPIKEHFIESLTHDSIIIQITELKNKRQKNELEKALSVFEQGTMQDVNVNEDDYPEKYKLVIRRLLKAAVNSEIRQIMDVEDEILGDLEAKERYIEKMEIKNKAIEEKNEIITKEKEEVQKENKAIVLKLAKMMKKYGTSTEEISKETGISEHEIEKL